MGVYDLFTQREGDLGNNYPEWPSSQKKERHQCRPPQFLEVYVLSRNVRYCLGHVIEWRFGVYLGVVWTRHQTLR